MRERGRKKELAGVRRTTTASSRRITSPAAKGRVAYMLRPAPGMWRTWKDVK